MDLKDRIVAFIKELRNSRDIESNWPAFHSLVESEQDDVVRTLSLRWLRGVCDTYADFGDPIERRNAFAISMFINMLRLAETTRYMRGDINPKRLAIVSSKRVDLYEELKTFHLHKQDVFLNMSKRMTRQVQNTGLMEKIWRETLRRLISGDNIITEMRSLSQMPERYFPIDPLEMADNYGVV